MDFANAAKAAVRFCGATKSPLPFQCVRLLPAGQGYPPRLYATNGIIGVYVKVDAGNLPNVLVPKEDLVPVSKEKEVLEVFDEQERLVVRTSSGTFSLRKKDINEFPPLPPVPPALAPLEEWPTVSKVVHAAGEAPGRPELGCVHFYQDRVEATDSFRVAVADVQTPIQTMAPADMFKHWPKNEFVWAAVYNGWVAFKVGGQLRVAPANHGRAPDCRQYVPENHDGSYLVADTKEMIAAAKRAAVVDGIVRMHFGENVVRVQGAARESEKAFDTIIHGDSGTTGGGFSCSAKMLINGKNILDALKAADTPNVRLCYKEGDDHPLRIESGGYAESIWTVLE